MARGRELRAKLPARVVQSLVQGAAGGYGHIALRDFGLLVGALALSRLASAHAARDKFAQSL